MCGRTATAMRASHYASTTRAQRWVGSDKFRPSYNVAPTRFQPVLVRGADGARELRSMHWGLVPAWSKAAKDGGKPEVRAINARDDSLREGLAMFAAAARRRRCAVLADGFYEWLKDGTARRPYYVRYPDAERPLVMAGIYEEWKDAAGEVLPSYCIVTTSSNTQLAFLHDRMPVLLDSDEAIDRWLDCEHVPTSAALSLLHPAETASLVVYPVIPLVNKVGNDSPDCIAPIAADAAISSSSSSPASSPASSARKRRHADDDGSGDNDPSSPSPKGRRGPASSSRPITAFFSPSSGGSELVRVDDHDAAWLSKRHNLVALGYDETAAEEALLAFDGDMERAANWLVDRPT